MTTIQRIIRQKSPIGKILTLHLPQALKYFSSATSYKQWHVELRAHIRVLQQRLRLHFFV